MSTMTFSHTDNNAGLITLSQIRLKADGLMLSLTWLLWLIALGAAGLARLAATADGCRDGGGTSRAV